MLLDRYESTIFNTVCRIVGDRDDAADITQSVFLKIYRNIHRYNPEYRFFSWMYRIALNESYNHLARKRPSAEVDPQIPAPGPGPEDDLFLVEMGDHLQRALGTMTFEYRTVIILKHLMLLSYHEIAQILGLPEKTVKSRLYSGRQVLRKQLLRQGYAS